MMRIDRRCTARPPTTGVVFCGKYDTLLRAATAGGVVCWSNGPFTWGRRAFG